MKRNTAAIPEITYSIVLTSQALCGLCESPHQDQKNNGHNNVKNIQHDYLSLHLVENDLMTQPAEFPRETSFACRPESLPGADHD